MKNNNRFISLFGGLSLLFLTTYFGFGGFHFGVLTMTSLLTNLGVFAGMILLTVLVMAPGIGKAPENFTMRFLILTTTQMLSVLSVVAAFVYLKRFDARTAGFELVCGFLFLLAAQSYFLIRFNKK